MHKNIQQLHTIASKGERTIIGLMSGTSLDGLDIAVCHISGWGRDTRFTLQAFTTVPYTDTCRNTLKACSQKNIDLQQLCMVHAWLGKQHAAMINDCLTDWQIPNTSIDLVASHGQTVYHAPVSRHGHTTFGNSTLQIGDADHIAINTGIITISDFRQKHIAAGGEGAPLASYGDYLLLGKHNSNTALLNIGGIANFTYLPVDGKVYSTDTGPGNTLMDAYLQQHFTNLYYDKDAAIALQGTVHKGLLAALLDHPFFSMPLPKTTGPELFNLAYLQQAMDKAGCGALSHADIMATLNRFTAYSIVKALQELQQPYALYVSGGGSSNSLLLQHLQKLLPGITIQTTASLGLNPHAKEAVLFALLANECVAGTPETFTGTGLLPVSMGKISFPA